MKPTFDIFKRLQDGNFFWVAADEDFDSARARLEKLSSSVPGHYLIHSQDRGFVLEQNTASQIYCVA
jgi:hypothetical protein